MKFSDLFHQYLQELDCTAKELSEETGLSPASLSRYRTGERLPTKEQAEQLLSGICSIASKKGLSHITEEQLRKDFQEVLEVPAFDYDRFTEALNKMIHTLDLNISELSRFMNFDSSYLSRIRLGQRRPANPEQFISSICQYVVQKKSETAIAELIGCSPEEWHTKNDCFATLCEWMSHGKTEPQNAMDGFLKRLDEFDLDEYIHAIHFNELKTPTLPFQLPTSKTYYGIEAMKQGELDFFKSTILSKSKEPVFMCSDMPMADMAKDLEFGKKWMFVIAMMLKKGLQLQIIHNVERPFQEMMLGLESWIPIYMTGQISPYYLKGRQNNVYCHFQYVSGQAALCGECIQGYHNDGKYYLTKNAEEVSYYRKKAALLLKKAQPLMNVYTKASAAGFFSFQKDAVQSAGERRNILSSLPLYTMPEHLLQTILERNQVASSDQAQILTYAAKERASAATILATDSITDEVPLWTEPQFQSHPMVLPLAGMFYEKELLYTFEDYQQHLSATQKFAEEHSNYTIITGETSAFQNIQIQICKGRWVLVTKNKAPAIHFVIRHPKILHAFENFVISVTEPT